MLLAELKYRIDNEISKTNESLTDTISGIKKYLNDFIKSNKDNFEKVFPRFKKYLSGLEVNNTVKKAILIFASSLLLNVGYPAYSSEIKDLTQQSTTNDKKDFSFEYKIGEYKINKNIIKDYILANKDGNSMSGTITVTISNDKENPDNKNFANDDTEKEKSKGGNLLQKRISEIEDILIEIQKEMLPYIININVKGKESDKREIKFSSIKTDEIPLNNPSEISNKKDKNNDVSRIGGGLKDISGLSRNYQFVEILSLGGIVAKKFNNNDIQKGDEYSKWIVNTRKRIKDFIFRLDNEYPEYNIKFDNSAKSFTPLSGYTATGGTNLKNQFNFVESFDSYINKDDVVKKWKRILGSSFPGITNEIAIKFDDNIVQLLEYLEQMYGGTALGFSFER